jgi:formamidopyrimidine-DNA glycosylase
MPELPEIEVICHGLRPLLIGRTITAVRESGKTLRRPVSLTSVQAQLIDRRIVAIERRAKYLQIFIDSGAFLVIHLGMTGIPTLTSGKGSAGQNRG